jgi:maltodextrin utilization protein YvdJ
MSYHEDTHSIFLALVCVISFERLLLSLIIIFLLATIYPVLTKRTLLMQ